MPRSQSEWREVVKALRAKAADPVVKEEEASALRAKATELEAKYCSGSSPITDDTTVTARDGRWIIYDEFLASFYGTATYSFHMTSPQTTEAYPMPNWDNRTAGKTPPDDKKIWDILRNLQRNQYQWNAEYYDKDGKPRAGYGGQADIVEEEFQDAPDEDEGYDIQEGDNG